MAQQESKDKTRAYSAEYFQLDAALKSLWPPFIELQDQMSAFVPKSLVELGAERAAMLEYLRSLNPTLSEVELLQDVNRQISLSTSVPIQFARRFSEPIQTQIVLITLTSHALCESVINAVLALGLERAGAHELFAVLEKTDMKEKWRIGPKSFAPSYELPKESALFEALTTLVKHRNAFAHSKISLQVGDETIFKGSGKKRATFDQDIRWMTRFFSLPYDLAEQAKAQSIGFPVTFALDRGPIARVGV